MEEMGSALGTFAGTHTATLANKRADHRHPSQIIKLDGTVFAFFDTGQATLTRIRVYPGRGVRNLHFSPHGQFKGLGSGPRGLGYGIRNIFGSLTGPSQKNATRRTVQWRQFGVNLCEETVCSLFDSKDLGHICRILTGFYGSAEDNHIHRDPDLSIQKGILTDDNKLAFLPRFDGLICNFGRFAPKEKDPLFLTPAVKLLVAFTITAHVNVEVIDLRMVPHLILNKVTVLQSIHAADTRAIQMVVHITATHAVNDSHTIRRIGERPLSISHEDLAVGGPGSVIETLELKAG
jgi:hypothetical protein